MVKSIHSYDSLYGTFTCGGTSQCAVLGRTRLLLLVPDPGALPPCWNTSHLHNTWLGVGVSPTLISSSLGSTGFVALFVDTLTPFL